MPSQTAVVFSNQEECKLLVIPLDLERFNGVYINCEGDEKLQIELTNILYPKPDCYLKYESVSNELFAKAIREGACMIQCGFIL